MGSVEVERNTADRNDDFEARSCTWSVGIPMAHRMLKSVFQWRWFLVCSSRCTISRGQHVTSAYLSKNEHAAVHLLGSMDRWRFYWAGPSMHHFHRCLTALVGVSVVYVELMQLCDQRARRPELGTHRVTRSDEGWPRHKKWRRVAGRESIIWSQYGGAGGPPVFGVVVPPSNCTGLKTRACRLLLQVVVVDAYRQWQIKKRLDICLQYFRFIVRCAVVHSLTFTLHTVCMLQDPKWYLLTLRCASSW